MFYRNNLTHSFISAVDGLGYEVEAFIFEHVKSRVMSNSESWGCNPPISRNQCSSFPSAWHILQNASPYWRTVLKKHPISTVTRIRVMNLLPLPLQALIIPKSFVFYQSASSKTIAIIGSLTLGAEIHVSSNTWQLLTPFVLWCS